VKLLTWNIQAGIGTQRYRDYLVRAHLQLFHGPSKTEALHNIAREITPYDIVCLQEVDLGGRRAGYSSQVEEIARLSRHAYVEVQENRRVPGISRHGNAILSHWPMKNVRDLKLPGRVAGRGCLVADVEGRFELTIACLHLSLGAADQKLQLARIANALEGADAWAAMGDFNCGARSASLETFCDSTGGHLSRTAPLTFPAWRPSRDYDHIVVAGELSVTQYQCEPATFSDHRPVSARLES
jgi:endonuclease/exonuclease/phosphatase family metal-dependent hydrolase